MKTQALILILALLVLTGCNFDPAVQRPNGGSGTDAGADAPTDARVPTDSSGQRDAFVARDGSPNVPDGSVPDGSAPRDMSAPIDMSAIDMSVPIDMFVPNDMAPPRDMNRPTRCRGQIVDLMTDGSHCGICNNACDPANGSCDQGQCTCAFGAMVCGSDNRCVNTDADPLHCGACGSACNAGEFCVSGHCECRPGLKDCNGTCVDTESDPSHCGQCNDGCGGEVCLDGECRNRNLCPIGTWGCPQPGGTACLRGQVNDLSCDPGLLNTCGTVCGSNEVCRDPPGVLTPPRCFTYRPGIGCTTCPCADCRTDEFCVQNGDLPNVAYCVSD